MKVYLNGKMVPLAEASISAQDAAVQHGVGLFETMQAFNGRVFRLEPHVDRLVQSAGELGLAAALRPRPLADVVEHTLEANKLTEARIRLTVTGGDLSLLGAAQAGGKATKHEPTVLCVASAPTEYPPAFLRGRRRGHPG
jgi:branched-subunit amino acid aminotransferase/4-amino-4-deoxychorismate lyase